MLTPRWQWQRREQSKRNREAFREVILQTARAQLAAGRLVVRRLANALEISEGALYLYFPSKSAICAELLRRDLAAGVDPVRAVRQFLPAAVCTPLDEYYNSAQISAPTESK